MSDVSLVLKEWQIQKNQLKSSSSRSSNPFGPSTFQDLQVISSKEEKKNLVS
jgi:hypothetical protein